MSRRLLPGGYRNIPTVDLYFRVPLHGLISERRFDAARPIRRLGPHCFAANGRVVIIRYMTGAELKAIRRLGPEQCIYLIDDDLTALDENSFLPGAYRDRLKCFSQEQLPQILALCDTVVAPNELIFNAYPGKAHLFLEPAATSICTDFLHFDNPRRIDILFSGTGSHGHDLALISDALAGLLRRQPRLRLTSFLGRQTPDSLRG